MLLYFYIFLQNIITRKSPYKILIVPFLFSMISTVSIIFTDSALVNQRTLFLILHGLPIFYLILYFFISLIFLSSLQLQTNGNSLKIRDFQNFQFSFTKVFEYEILFFPSKIPKPLGERKYNFFKNPIFPQKPRGIPKHSRF